MRPVFLPAVLFAAVLAGCDSNSQVTDAAAGKQPPPLPVKVHVVGAAAESASLRLPGELRAAEEVRLGFRVAGKLIERQVDVGAQVRRGQVLAQLDAQDYQLATGTQAAQLEAAKADRAFAVSELKRVQQMMGQDYVSQAQVDRQQAATDAAVARVRALEAQVAQMRNQATYTRLLADTAGVVTAVEAEPGQVVQAGQSIVRIARGGALEAVVQVPEARLAEFRASRAYEVTVSALGDKRHTARLVELSPQADPATRGYNAKLAIDAPEKALTLGMSITLHALPAAPAAGFAVPAASLHTRGSEPRVWLIEGTGNTVRPVPVVTGGLSGEQVVVRSGLKAGDRIVAAGAHMLVPGQRVRPIQIKS